MVRMPLETGLGCFGQDNRKDKVSGSGRPLMAFTGAFALRERARSLPCRIGEGMQWEVPAAWRLEEMR